MIQREMARLIIVVASLCLWSAAAPAALAAEPNGTIVLTVRDQANAAIPRAVVGIVRDGVTSHVRVDEHGRSGFTFPANTPIDICGGYEFVSPTHPLSCVRGIAVSPNQTRAVDLVVDMVPFSVWVSAFASPDWLRGFSPFWVQNHVPDVTLWSGPDDNAMAFGVRRQWSEFQVAGPQVGPRLYVFDLHFMNYAWVDAAAVGPSGPPTPQIDVPVAASAG